MVLTELRDDEGVRWGCGARIGAIAAATGVGGAVGGVMNGNGMIGGVGESSGEGQADQSHSMSQASRVWRGMPLFGKTTPRVPIILPDP